MFRRVFLILAISAVGCESAAHRVERLTTARRDACLGLRATVRAATMLILSQPADTARATAVLGRVAGLRTKCQLAERDLNQFMGGAQPEMDFPDFTIADSARVILGTKP